MRWLFGMYEAYLARRRERLRSRFRSVVLCDRLLSSGAVAGTYRRVGCGR